MTTAASPIAQFMALISGSVNPSLLRQSINGNTTPLQTIDFESLIGKQLNTNIPSVNLDLGNIAVPDTIDSSTSGIWRVIQQQANLDGQNSVVINLSEKGLSSEAIEELTDIFSASDLITVLRDPDLNAQLDQIITDLNLESGSSDLITAVETLLTQNIDTTNTVSFKKSDLIDDNVVAILTGSITDAQPRTNPVQNNSSINNNPVNNVEEQARIAPFVANQTSPVKSETTVSKGKAPLFSIPGGEGDTTTSLKEVIPSVHTRSSANNDQSYQSIADRLASLSKIGNSGLSDGNVSSLSQDFQSVIVGADGHLMIEDSNALIRLESGFKTASIASNNLLNQPHAAQPHPTSQMVAFMLTKMTNNKTADGESQIYRLQLDPPEMGRLDIEMDFLDGGRVKAVVVADKPEALGLLQRDMHVLVKAMQDAGFEGMNNSDLSFNLNQNKQDSSHSHQSDTRHNQSESNGQSNLDDLNVVETEMSIIIDPITGQQSVNMLV